MSAPEPRLTCDPTRRAELRRPDDSGAIAVFVALLIPVLLIFTAIAVDISRWYVEMQRLQKAVDAGALAAAPFMPESLQNNQPNQAGPYDKATAAARDLVSKNGFPGIRAHVEQGGRPSQVRVTLSSAVDNAFASLIGINQTTITRSSVAEFSGPAPLGSPCNVHGNEPWVSGGNPGSVLPPNPPAANCSNYPQFWSTIVGPEVYKTQGDQYAARKCSPGSPESGCGTSNANTEFDPRGYVITINVREDLATGLPIEIYDPAYIDTESRCDALPNITDNTPGTNVFPTYVNDATRRYRANPNPISAAEPSYCTGDNDNSGQRYGGEIPTVTSFGLIKPTDTFNPFDTAANSATNRVASCYKQYPGFNKTGGGNNEWESTQAGAAPGANATAQLSRPSELTRLLHRWDSLCTIPGPVAAGEYYLRVRSNVPDGASADTMFDFVDHTTVRSNGSNRFAVRAVTSASDRTKVSVSPFAKMPIFANSDNSNAVFNLVRVLPGNAGQTINFTFFDVGDAGRAPGATLSVLTPSGSAATNCTKEGKQNGADADCSISGIYSGNGWNGQFQRMRIPIPSTYTCDFNNPFACWWRLRVQFSGGVSVTDQTTWTAVVEGDPVRIIE